MIIEAKPTISPIIFLTDNFSLKTKYPTKVATKILIALDTGKMTIDGTVLLISVTIILIKNRASASNVPHITNFLPNSGLCTVFWSFSLAIIVFCFLNAIKKHTNINKPQRVKVTKEKRGVFAPSTLSAKYFCTTIVNPFTKRFVVNIISVLKDIFLPDLPSLLDNKYTAKKNTARPTSWYNLISSQNQKYDTRTEIIKPPRLNMLATAMEQPLIASNPQNKLTANKTALIAEHITSFTLKLLKPVKIIVIKENAAATN